MNQYNPVDELSKKIVTIPVDHRDDPTEVITSTLKSYNLIYGCHIHGAYIYHIHEKYKYADIYKEGEGEGQITVII